MKRQLRAKLNHEEQGVLLKSSWTGFFFFFKLELLAEEDEHKMVQFLIIFVLVNAPKVDNFTVLALCKMKKVQSFAEPCRELCCMVCLIWEAIC